MNRDGTTRIAMGPLAGLLVVMACAEVGALQTRPGEVPDEVVRNRVRDHVSQAWATFEVADFAAALAHAEAATADAEKVFPVTNPFRRNAPLLVRLARSGKAAAEADLKTAKVEADAALVLARKLPPGSPMRAQTLVYAAGFYLSAMKDPRTALALFDEVEPLLAAARADARDLVRKRDQCAVLASFLREDRVDPEHKAMQGPAGAVVRRVPGDNVLGPVARELWEFLIGRALEQPAPNRAAVEETERRLRADLDRAGRILRGAGAPDSLVVWGDLYLLRFQHDRGRFGAAETTLAGLASKARAAAGSGLDADLLAEFQSYSGLLATRRGDFVAARAAHEEERRIRKAAKLPGMHRTLNSLGRLLLRVGDYPGAEEVLDEATRLCGSNPRLASDPVHSIILTQLGRALEGAGDANKLRQATALHRKAVSLAESAARREPATVAMCRNNLGVNRYASGDLAGAGAEFLAARKSAVEASGEPSLSVAEVDVNLGWVARARGKLDEAESLFRAALRGIDADGTDSRRRAEVLGYLASVLGPGGRPEDARKAIDEALRLREAALRRALRSAFSERERLAIAQELRFHPESRAWPGVLDTFLELAPTLKVDAEAQYARVLVWKGAVGRGSIVGPSATGDRPRVQKLLTERAAALAALRAEAAEVPSPAERQSHEDRLAVLEDRIDDVERRLRAEGRDSAELKDAAPSDVLAVVPKGWALVDVIEVRTPGILVQAGRALREGRRYLAFVSRPGRPVARIDLGDAVPIDTSIRGFLRVMDAQTAAYVEPAKRLGTLVMDPLRPLLDGAEGIVLAGDGLLHRLPLAALPGAKPDTFLVEDLAIATVPTAQSLIARREARPNHPGALIVGDVEYDSYAGLAGLPKTRQEAEAVAASFRATHPGEPVTMLTQREASEPKVRSLLASRGLVHLATHGLFPEGTKLESSDEAFGAMARLDSSIVLAKSPGGAKGATEPDDQKLTADELGQLDMRGVGLVVLSACSSGLGHISAGQGVVGLIGALDRTGARSVACSLWKVDDSATAALMESFYGHLWGKTPGVGPASALRSAQVELIRREPRTFSHPRFWAAFVISGDPG